MTAADRRLPMLRRMALLCALLMLATIALSAFMRLSQAGLGCADWPACYGQGQHGSPEAVAAARLAHRAVASLALIGVMTMALAAWTARPLLRREKWLTLALLALALALAALGIVTPGARLPAVTMGNLLGGFAMLALCARLAAPGRADSAAAAAGSAASPAAATSATSATSAASAAAAAAAAAASAAPGLGAWGIAGLALLSIQLALGALVSASHAALACTDLADCARAAQAQGWDWRALNPWQAAPIGATLAPAGRGGALALLLHRLAAGVVLPALALLGIAAWRRGRRRAGWLLLALAVAQPVLGLLIVATGLPLALVLLHNLVAALLLATLVGLL